MDLSNNLIYEVIAPVDKIDAQLANNTTVSSGWNALAQLGRMQGFFCLGATDIAGTFKIQVATDSSGTGAVDLATAAFTATDDNKQYAIEVLVGDIADTFTHARIQAVIGNGSTGANVAAALFGARNRYGEAYSSAHTSFVKSKYAVA